MSHVNYLCRYRLDGQDLYLIWYTNDVDGVWLENRKVPVFRDRLRLLEYAAEHRICIKPEEPRLHNLDLVSEWLAHPDQNTIDCDALNTAWNLFSDVSSSMGGDFDSDKDLTHEVYEKLFQGMNLPAVTPESKQCQPTWAKDEIELMRQVLLHGLSLFRTCTVEKV